MNKKYRNKHCEAIHSAASGLYKAGVINVEEMRYYDDSCLTKPAATVSQTPCEEAGEMSSLRKAVPPVKQVAWKERNSQSASFGHGSRGWHRK